MSTLTLHAHTYRRLKADSSTQDMGGGERGVMLRLTEISTVLGYDVEGMTVDLFLDTMNAIEIRNALDMALAEIAGVEPDEEQPECEGHPAGPDDPMGETVYCDGSCQKVS